MVVIYCLVIGFVVIFILCSVFLRTLISHPFKSVRYAAIDLYHYIKYKKWRNAPTGSLLCFCGLFGKGKTLSAVHYCVNMYERFNDLQVYVPGRGWVVQKVQIVSNVSLAIPYVKFESMQQIVDIGKNQAAIDEALGVITYTYVLGDEFSVQLNSRAFKSNIDPLFLSTLLQERHFRISMVYTSQKFNLTDKLLRDVTFEVIDCNKIWRIMCHHAYDAHDYENASQVSQIKPLRSYGWFIQDKDFNSYNTLECVGNLIKSCEDGDMISEEEILKLREGVEANENAIVHQSRKFKRGQKKKG